jgi:sugar/nucleoside kinase (ribokinase family)
VNNHLHFDYTTVGHVTVDVLEDGSRRAGGTAFYSALQAARLGQRTSIITQGVPDEIEALLAPHREELDLTVLPASATTTLRTAGRGAERSQRLLAWAGPIVQQLELDTSILHLAPVVREGPGSWRGHAAFVGLTAQGLARRWDPSTGQISHTAPDTPSDALAERCHALVVNEAERACCAELIAVAGAAGALVAVTDGDAPVAVLAPAGPTNEVPVPALSAQVDDLGAGDVFAAALFVALSEAQSPLEAVRFASAAAAVRMSGAGADAIGDRSAIQARLLATV